MSICISSVSFCYNIQISHKIRYIAQSAGALEYTDYTSAEE